MDDPIIEELRAIKRENAKRYGHDLKAMCDDLRREGEATESKTVSFEPRRLKGRKAAA